MAYEDKQLEALHHFNEARALLMEQKLQREIESRQRMLDRIRDLRKRAHAHRKGVAT